MNKIALIGAAMLTAGTLAAEVVMDYNPGKPDTAKWDYWCWRTNHPRKELARTPEKAGEVSVVKLVPDIQLGVSMKDPKFAAFGDGNLSVSVLFRTTGNKGFSYLFYNGAGDRKMLGIRMDLRPDGKGSMRPVLFVVFKNTSKDFVESGKALKDGMPQNEWCVMTAVIDRAGKASLYFNGELVQSMDVSAYKDVKVFPHGLTSFGMDGHGYSVKDGVATPVDGAVKTEVARILIHDEALPLVKLQKEVDDLLDSVEK